MGTPKSKDIIPVLHRVLNNLIANPYPHVPTPSGCKKRASVAIVLRIRPAFQPIPPQNSSSIDSNPTNSSATSIDDFFAREWVKNGDPEILFIKRAGRAGDRWSGHVALPGGKRDPEDETDVAAAIRETREEVGLELNTPGCLSAGNLPERVVATTFGREALMVLCPYIFLLTSKTPAPVLPQPTEVAAAHWVPLRALLSENLRTREYVDTTSRMAKQGGPIAQLLLRALVGRMVFSAVHLAPSESVYASSIPGFVPSTGESRLSELLFGTLARESSIRRLTHQQPLLLWGLTLGVLADLLDMLPPHNAVKLWRYPTFTPPDLRFLVFLFTRSIRKKHNDPGQFSAGTWPSPRRRRPSQTAIDATSHAVAYTEAEPSKLAERVGQMQNEVGIGGLGVGSSPKDAVGKLLSGYYERINKAVIVFVIYRVVVGSTLGYWFYKLWLKRRALKG